MFYQPKKKNPPSISIHQPTYLPATKHSFTHTNNTIIILSLRIIIIFIIFIPHLSTYSLPIPIPIPIHRQSWTCMIRAISRSLLWNSEIFIFI